MVARNIFVLGIYKHKKQIRTNKGSEITKLHKRVKVIKYYSQSEERTIKVLSIRVTHASIMSKNYQIGKV